MMTANRGTTKDQLMRQICQAGFAMDDAKLFLDTHPCDETALSYYKQANAIYRDAVASYTAQFGSLTAPDSASAAYWNWVEGPWPCEGGDQ